MTIRHLIRGLREMKEPKDMHPASAHLVAQWERSMKFGKKPKDFLPTSLASLALGREFGEPIPAYYERKGFTDAVAWAKAKLGI